jgi:hypothetical protein
VIPFYAETQRIRETIETVAGEPVVGQLTHYRRTDSLVNLIYKEYYRGSVGFIGTCWKWQLENPTLSANSFIINKLE